jgi:hypothetical protein
LENAAEVASASLYLVTPEDGKAFEDFASELIDRGGPSESDCVPAFGEDPSVEFNTAGSTCTIQMEEIGMPSDRPFYLVLKDGAGEVLQEVLFGPLYEDTSAVYSLKEDLDRRR